MSPLTFSSHGPNDIKIMELTDSLDHYYIIGQ